jgi:protein-disulfide isomerase
MGVISTQLHSYCLFCISAYALSFIAFFCYRATLQEPFFANFAQDIPHLWNESKGILLGFAAVPVLAVVGHRVALEAYGVTQLEKVVQTSINEWITAPAVNFSVPPALSMGPSRDQAKMVIAEFADFRCSHCRHAYPSLDHFAKSHPEVRLEFYNFPLDGECNEVIPDKNGISCRLAYAVTCAEKQGHGWQLHHALYDDQDKINGESLRGVPLDDEIKTVAQNVGINSASLFQCMSEPTTADAVRLQAKLGGDAKIQGTPSIFINSKMMDRGQLIPVMEAALTASKNQAR